MAERSRKQERPRDLKAELKKVLAKIDELGDEALTFEDEIFLFFACYRSISETLSLQLHVGRVLILSSNQRGSY